MDGTSTSRELYGGAITSDVPTNWIDASTLREIPDHQEVFLSPTTLCSLIFEINQYLHPSETPTSATLTSATIPPHDIAAVHTHLADTIEPPDTLSPAEPPITPIRTKAGGTSQKLDVPAYMTTSTTITDVTDGRADERQRSGGKTKVWQLVIRLKKYDTDLCVRMNCPLKEGGEASEDGDGRVVEGTEEFRRVEEVIKRVAETLEIRDFGLFGDGM